MLVYMGDRVLSLRAPLEQLYREFDYKGRIKADAVQLLFRYPDPEDQEVVGLIASSLAYGRVDLFAPQVARVLAPMGPHPRTFILSFSPKRGEHLFDGFRYRFNRPRDIVALCLAIQALLDRHGSLRQAFLKGYSEQDPDIRPALERFVDEVRGVDYKAVFGRGGPSRGFLHLFPHPAAGGPCKRLNLYLRWMVRRGDGLDFGLWPEVSPAMLIIPLDTHVAHMSACVGLTRLGSRTWRMAEEITRNLRRLDPKDPVKYDFALCHKRMSGECRGRRHPTCLGCGLRRVCRCWPGEN